MLNDVYLLLPRYTQQPVYFHDGFVFALVFVATGNMLFYIYTSAVQPFLFKLGGWTTFFTHPFVLVFIVAQEPKGLRAFGLVRRLAGCKHSNLFNFHIWFWPLFKPLYSVCFPFFFQVRLVICGYRRSFVLCTA